MELNPRSVLVDKHRASHKRQHTPTNDQSLRVTFAKPTSQNQSNVSSNASMIPFSKTGAPTQGMPKTPLSGNQYGNNAKAGKGENDKNKPGDASNRTGMSNGAKAQTPGSTGQSYPTSQKSTKNHKTIVTPATLPDHSSPKRSVESSDNEQNRGKDSLNRVPSAKSKKLIRKLAKFSSRSIGGTPQRSKSGKKLKQKRSSSANEETEEMEPTIQPPAQLDAEYASELSKITQILKAVSVFDATTSTGNAAVHTGTSTRIKITSHTEDDGSGTVRHKSMHRPLSTGELKQLLSSITRVVSLHQLPQNDQASSSGLKNTSSGSKVKAKKAKKGKLPGTTYISANREAVRTKSRTSNRSNKSKDNLRKGRSKKKSDDRSKPRKTNSDGSSISSTEKDPARHAAFLTKYFEESIRLADKKSSEDVVAGSEPLTLQDEQLSPEVKQNKKNRSGSAVSNRIASKESSKASVPPSKKVAQPPVTPLLQPSVKAFNAAPGERANDLSKRITEPPKIQRQAEPASKSQHANSPLSNTKHDYITRGKSASSNISTTAVAGSPKSQSPAGRVDGENVNTSDQGRGRPTTGKTPIIDPTSNKAARQQQIKSIEEVINSKFTGNTDKMKSIWEKAPYLPMTHARFKDMVNRYGNSEANAAIKGVEDGTPSLHTSAKTLSTADEAPDKSLAVPAPLTVTVKEDPPNHNKVGAQLHGTPGYWPDSEMATSFNRLNYDYRANMRKEARQIRKRFRDDVMRSNLSRPTTTREGYFGGITGVNTRTVNEALKYYSEMIRRDARSK